MNLLVTGGAGYIGSHAVKLLVEAGHSVCVIDNLFRGHAEAVHPNAIFYQCDLRDTVSLRAILDRNSIDCVMHFAAKAYIGESVDQPLDYYDNNTAGTLCLLDAMHQVGVRKLVFSSTCATYGEPEIVPIVETTPQQPINPYGRSKLFVEHVLKDFCEAESRFACIALRYFNVAGCASDGSLGEDHTPETHLIPIVLQAALGQRDGVTILGTDYPTPDGTCIRDYVHVEDLARAHLLVMKALQPGQFDAYNVGIGRGYSVREIIHTVQSVTRRTFPIEEGQRRPGDPPTLFADATKIRKELGWKPRHTNIKEVVTTAWNWFQHHPHGYTETTANRAVI